MTFTVVEVTAAAMVFLAVCGLCILQWVWIKALTKAARQVIGAVHDFTGFMGGLACGPAESELCERCLPLAGLIEYEGGRGR